MIRSICVALLLACGTAWAQGPKPGSIAYRGKSYEVSSLPAEVGAAARQAIVLWQPWAKPRGYRLDLDPTRRVLLVTSRSNSDAQMGLVIKALAHYDSIFPVVTVGASATLKPDGTARPTKASAPPVDEIPEDPESPPPGAPPTLPPEVDEVAAVRDEPTGFRADSQTAVMLVAKNTTDYASALELLATQHPFLGEWVPLAKVQIGFTLGEPLIGAYNENSPGQEEWNPDNELVHRTMALLVLRRFSELPFWLHTGFCWHAEMAINKSIYCMPHRDGFVGIGEHGGWLASLNSLFADRAKRPLTMPELAMVRGEWNDTASKAALGMVEYMVRSNPRALWGMLEELRLYREQHGRTTAADGTWKKLTTYEVPHGEQQSLLQKYYGAQVMSDVIRFWTTGELTPVK